MASSTPENEKSMVVPIPPIKAVKNITLMDISEIGYFSRGKSDSGYVVFHDERQLRAYKKNHGKTLDLLAGYGTISFEENLSSTKPLGVLEEYMDDKGLFDQSKVAGSRTVVSSAGAIRELAVIPYSRYSRNFRVERKRDGVLFIAKASGKYEKEWKRKNRFQGKRFELYMTQALKVDNEGFRFVRRKKRKEKIDPNESFCAVFQANLSESNVNAATNSKVFTLIYTCEIDCKDEKLGKYVELKTKTKQAFDEKTAKFDFLHWYLILKFTTIDRIECGLRNDKLHRIHVFKIFNQEILKEEYPKHNEYQPREQFELKLFPEDETLENAGRGCMHFLYELLCFIDDNVRSDENWTIRYSSPSAQYKPWLVTLKKLD